MPNNIHTLNKHLTENQWPPDTRRNVLFDLFMSRGTTNTPQYKNVAELYGVPLSTVRRWYPLELNGHTQYLTEIDHQEIEVLRKHDWQEQKANWIDRVTGTVNGTFNAVDKSIAEHDGRNARDFATVLGISIDKAMLLAGESTSRQKIDVEHRGTITQKHVAVLPPKEVNPALFQEVEVVETQALTDGGDTEE